MAVSAVDPHQVKKVARRLARAVNSRHGDVTDARLDRIGLWAMRSARRTDTAFAAVQLLRDRGRIDRAEAAYLLDALYEYRDDQRSSRTDPNLVRAFEEGVELELISAALVDERTARHVTFFQERGEEELADMVLGDAEAYLALCVDGGMSLIDSKDSSDSAAEPVQPPAVPDTIAERIMALSAVETNQEWMLAWQALCDAWRDLDDSTVVLAIQSVRAVGGISFDQSVKLMHFPVRSLVEDALESDREAHRLVRALDDCAARHGIGDIYKTAHEARPLEWRALDYQWGRRVDAITAMILRRFGEHRQANLVSLSPAEYYRIVDTAEVGAMKVPDVG